MGANPRPIPKQASAIDISNGYLFTGAVGLLLYDLLGSFLGHQLVQGIPIEPSLADIPLILGLLVLFRGNFNYYKKIIEPFGEPSGQGLFSLVGMLCMFSLPVVLFVRNLIPFRFLIMAAYGILIVVKNWQLKRRFRSCPLGAHFKTWIRRAIAQTGAGVACGFLFYVLVAPNPRDWLFHLLIETPTLSFKSNYLSYVKLPFNIIFLMMCILLYLFEPLPLDELNIEQAVTKQ
jgi:hypothetical protein